MSVLVTLLIKPMKLRMSTKSNNGLRVGWQWWYLSLKAIGVCYSVLVVLVCVCVVFTGARVRTYVCKAHKHQHTRNALLIRSSFCPQPPTRWALGTGYLLLRHFKLVWRVFRVVAARRCSRFVAIWPACESSASHFGGLCEATMWDAAVTNSCARGMHLRMYTLSCRYFIVRGRLHVSRCVYICMYAYCVCPN